MAAAQVIEPLAVNEYSDNDSAYDERSLSTASVRSSIYEFQQENGRSYHAYKAGKYVMPNDEGEQERMDIHYHALRLVLNNKHWFAPIENPTSALDVGTGTGIWAMDVADDFPSTEVVGIDLSPIQPTSVPSNLVFEITDADESWDMTRRFDLIHTRFMNGFLRKGWPHFYEQAFKNLAPGGWVENQECDSQYGSDDNSIPPDSSFKKWEELWNEGMGKFGLSARCHPEDLKAEMEKAGFINVGIQTRKVPLGPWPKDPMLRQAGLFFLAGMLDGISGLSVRVFTQGLGWSVEDMNKLIAGVKKDWKRKDIHSYVTIHVVYGQKPPA